MMPLFTSALKTLKAHEVARGSTLLNINQQIGSSVGVAVISVILTAHLNASELAKPAMAATLDPTLTDAVGGAAAVAAGLAEAAAAFADTFWVAWVLVVLTLVPAFFLPRKHEQLALVDGAGRGRPAGRSCTDAESAHLQPEGDDDQGQPAERCGLPVPGAPAAHAGSEVARLAVGGGTGGHSRSPLSGPRHAA